jgi:hypothetical protein
MSNGQSWNTAGVPASGNGRLDNKLRQIFPEDEIYLVTDDELLAIAAADHGQAALMLADAEKLPHGANVVLLLRHSLVTVDIRRMFRNAKVLLVPIASFDTSLEAALYTQKLTMLTDYSAALDRSRYWADSIATQAGPLIFSDAAPGEDAGDEEKTHLVCSLGNDINADAWLEPKIGTGQWISVGTLCEFSMTAPSSADWCSAFVIDGTAVAAGVLVARDSRFSEAGHTRIQAAQRLQVELAARAPITLQLAGGVLTSVRAGGEDFTDAVREVTNPEHGLHTLELGIGTNQSVLPHVDWKFNSQLNEGAGAVHLGFGEGITGAHMDFVIAESGHQFQPSA